MSATNVVLGATAQSWSGPSARHILEELVNAKPSATKEVILADLIEVLRKEENASLVDSIIEYWFYNNYRYLTRPRAAAGALTERRAFVDQTKAAVLQRAKQLVLLDLMLPNEKTLANTTGQECRDLAPKVGAWLTRIAEQVPPDATVGGSLSEQTVRALYEAA